MTALTFEFSATHLDRVRRGVQLVVGCVTVGVGLAVLVRCGLGLDPYRSLLAGIGRLTGTPFGTTNIAVGLLLVSVAWWPGRVRPRVGTAAQPVLVGLTLNAVLPHVGSVGDGIVDRAIVAAAALLLTGIGGGLYLGADLGATSFDAVSIAVHRVAPQRSFAAVYSLLLVVAVTAAWAARGPIGVVTVAALPALGPVTSAVRRWSLVW